MPFPNSTIQPVVFRFPNGSEQEVFLVKCGLCGAKGRYSSMEEAKEAFAEHIDAYCPVIKELREEAEGN